MVNKSAVSIAPYHTGGQGTFTSGRYLKISAKRPVTTPSETKKFTTIQNQLMPMALTMLARMVFTTSDTSRMNAVPITSVSEKNRCRTMVIQVRLGSGLTPHTTFIESCNSP